MRNKTLIENLIFFLFILFIPNYAFADGGIPFFIVDWGYQILALIVVIVLENWYLKKKFVSIDKKKILKVTIRANLVSTLIGMLCLFIIREWGFRSWCKYEECNDIAALFFADPLYLGIYRLEHVSSFFNHIILLISCFIMTWILESVTAYFMIKKDYSFKNIIVPMFFANLLSYLVLFGPIMIFPILFWIVYFVVSIVISPILLLIKYLFF